MRSVKRLRAFSLFVEYEIIRSGNDAVEYVVLLGKFENFIGRVSLTPGFLPSGGIMNPQKHHACRTLIGKRFEQHVVDHAENRRRCSDS